MEIILLIIIIVIIFPHSFLFVHVYVVNVVEDNCS